MSNILYICRLFLLQNITNKQKILLTFKKSYVKIKKKRKELKKWKK